MKRPVMLIVALVFACDMAYPQMPKSIQPVTLIEARDGSGPGELNIVPEQSPLHGFAIDDQEHIYILDALNNRLQEYDDNGKLIRSIPISSSSPTTPDEQKRGLAAKIITVEAIDFINGSLYAVQQRATGDARHPGRRHLIRMEGGGFVNVDDDKAARGILNMLTPAHYNDLRARDLREGFSQLGTTQEKFVARHPLEKSRPILGILRDKDGDIWSVGNTIRVYSPTGALIYEKSEQYFITTEFSTHGNLYVMAYYVDSATQYWAIRITKYSLSGK